MEITKKLPIAKNGSPKAKYFSGFGSKMTKRGDIESRFWFQQKKKLESRIFLKANFEFRQHSIEIVDEM